MQEAAYKVRQFYEDGKTYFTKETPFKDRHLFHKRQEEAQRIMKKYPNRIPVICECVGGEVPDIDRKKYLVPSDLSMAEFLYVIRKRIKIKPEQSIYLFVGDSVMVAGAQHIGSVFYTCYSGENTFG